jgi:hypothetical protein
MVTMATSIVSRGRSRRWLELGEGAGVLRVTTNASIPCEIGQPGGQGDALVKGKEDGG